MRLALVNFMDDFTRTVEILHEDKEGAIFQYLGTVFLGGKVFQNQLITKRYTHNQYEILEEYEDVQLDS